MQTKKISLLAATALALAGCGNIPDVTVNYYFPHAKTVYAVTQTIGCNAKADNTHRTIRSVISVAPTTANSADLDWIVKGEPYQGHLAYKSFHSTFSDADASVTLTADGRLSGINATSTGEGSTIIQDVVTAAGAIALMTPSKSDGGTFQENTEDLACDQVDIYAAVPTAAGDKPGSSVVTLTYTVTVSYDFPDKADPAFVVDTVSSPNYTDSSDKSELVLIPDASGAPAYQALHAVLGNRMDTTLKMITTKAKLQYLNTISPLNVSGSDVFPLELNRVATVALEIDGHVGDLNKQTPIWSGSAEVPVRQTYELAIPSPATFGKTAFGLQLSDNGAITQLHYGSNTGVGDATNALGAVAKALQSESPEDRATDIKGQADLIAQQQRLVRCQVSPTSCT
jgi:hypothetical protein